MIETFYNLLSKVGITSQQDKVLHFIVGIGLGVVGQVLSPDSIHMIAPVVLGAVGKEIYDKYIKKTKFDFFDMFATIAGGFVGIVVFGLLIG